MLKTLMSNVCVNDCKYCPYRNDRDAPRVTIGSDEIARVFMEYVRRNIVFGLFLSSGVVGTPDRTMQILNDTARIIRRKYHYRGYIHLKVIPGASDAAIEDALSLSSAVSINIETPGQRHCAQLSQKKDFIKDIIGPLRKISDLTARGAQFAGVKKTTQFIVGAADETDAEIVKYTSGLYNRLNLNRVYFSSYQRGLGRSDIPGEQRVEAVRDESFVREHRLYQVDFLFRKYGFTESEIIFNNDGRLSLEKDPKQLWAESHPEWFPVNINRAEKNMLLRIPGIGPETAKRIMRMRREGRIGSVDDLPVKGKRLEVARRYLVV